MHFNKTVILLVAAVFLIQGTLSVVIKNKMTAEFASSYGNTNPGQACSYQAFGTQCVRGYTCSVFQHQCVWDTTITSSGTSWGSVMPGQPCKYQTWGTQCVKGYSCSGSSGFCQYSSY